MPVACSVVGEKRVTELQLLAEAPPIGTHQAQTADRCSVAASTVAAEVLRHRRMLAARFLVTPVVVAPMPMPSVAVDVAMPMLAEAADTVMVHEAVTLPKNHLAPVNVWVPARIANSRE